ncbi:MAG: fibronectin type III domain-containing protein [Bacillota bacterium]|nr:fibronectin type III domain-containing protein [Bacillota bacterium]
MKRFLAATLAALMLLAFLPLASPPALAAIDFTIRCSIDSAYVGETIWWEVKDIEGGTPPYHYNFDIYRNGVLYSPECYESLNHWRVFTPALPGKYKVMVWVGDNDDDTNKFSDEITVTANPNRITKVEPLGPTSLKITWNKVSGAMEYELWRTTSLNTDWVWVKSTGEGETSVTDTNLKAGTRYYYQLRYYKENIYDSWLSPVAAGVPMGKTRITSINSPLKGRVRLVWAKAAGASGYQVAMATSARGSYRTVRQLTGNSITFTGLKSGSALYYKIRPYRKIYSATYWGQYSGYRSVRVK